MDKSWISKSSLSEEYEKGLNEFLDFAFAHTPANGMIRCPCSRCAFRRWQTREDAYDHLICTQFPQGYIVWDLHGESVVNDASNAPQNNLVGESNLGSEDTLQDMVCDAFGVSGHHGTTVEATHEVEANTNEFYSRQRGDDTNFVDLLRDCNEELYEGCTKYSKLSFIIKLYHIKVLCRMSDKAMSMILELLHDAFENSKIPNSLYEAKKIINKLGLNYIKIDACPNDCMLYWREDANRESCKVCGQSRWKDDVNASRMIGEGKKKKKKKKRPAKVLRYFPLKPRLRRLFMCSKTANLMRWHHEDVNNDGQMRHPRDSEAWKSFNMSHNEFASEPRNVRLGLASDGFNPFGTMSTKYSIWPVVLMAYNLPPWMCMKQSSIILSMIIPGKKQPGNDIDVYLQPLIEELNELWTEGIETYDASLSENFTLRATLMWTISDFPGLGKMKFL